jgi:hypothetical protein
LNTSKNTFTNNPQDDGFKNLDKDWIIATFSTWLEEYKPANATSVEIFNKWEDIKVGKN